MKINYVNLTVEDPQGSAEFYGSVLGLPTSRASDRVTVDVGATRLKLVQGTGFAGVHHVAFGIPPEDFATARTFLHERVDPVRVDGADVIDGPAGWDSRSVYFLGPEGIVLEYIAREHDRGAQGAAEGASPRVLSVSEVGIGVEEVPHAVQAMCTALDQPRFPPQEETFAPIGDHEGLLIVVQRDRLWFPPRNAPAARGPLQIGIDRGHGPQSEHRPMPYTLVRAA